MFKALRAVVLGVALGALYAEPFAAGAQTVDDMTRALGELPAKGTAIRFARGSFDFPPGGHVQGIQLRYDAALRRHLVFLSHDSVSHGYLVIVEFAAGLAQPGHVLATHAFPSDGRSPPLRHAGGIQLVGNLLVVGLEDNQQKTRSEVQFWDVSNPEKLRQWTYLTVHRSGAPKEKTAGAVGLVAHGQGHLLAVANWDSRAVDFYTTNGHSLDDPACRFELHTRWQEAEADKNDWAPDKAFTSYQAINLASDAAGSVYLLAFATTPTGADVVDLFRVHLDGKPAVALRKLARKPLTLAVGNHFQYGGGAWVDGMHLNVLASPREAIGETRLTIVR